MAREELFGRPVYNHVMEEGECLSEAASIMKLRLRTLQVAELEVRGGGEEVVRRELRLIVCCLVQ